MTWLWVGMAWAGLAADHGFEGACAEVVGAELGIEAPKKVRWEPRGTTALVAVYEAENLYESEKHAEAEAVLRAELARDGRTGKGWVYLGRSLLAQGREAEATTALLVARAALPEDPIEHSRVAGSLYTAGHAGCSGEVAAEALERFPASATLWRRLVHAERKEGDHAGALAAIESGRAEGLPASMACLEIYVRIDQGRVEQAEALEELCLESEESWLKRGARSTLASATGDVTTAARHSRRLGSDSTARLREARVAWAEGLHGDALRRVEHAISEDPDDVWLRIQRARWLLGMGRGDEALGDLAAVFDPEEPLVEAVEHGFVGAMTPEHEDSRLWGRRRAAALYVEVLVSLGREEEARSAVEAAVRRFGVWSSMSSWGEELEVAEAPLVDEICADPERVELCRGAARAYERGWWRWMPRPERAAELYAGMCEAGDGASCHRLGYLHRSGQIEHDEVRGVALYERSCALGDDDGCTGLSWALRRGRGVAQDLERADAVLDEQCSAGDRDACSTLARSLYWAPPAWRDVDRAAELWGAGCEAKHEASCRSWATMSTYGVVEGDGHAVLSEGCSDGDVSACMELVRRGSGDVASLVAGCDDDGGTSCDLLVDQLVDGGVRLAGVGWEQRCSDGDERACGLASVMAGLAGELEASERLAVRAVQPSSASKAPVVWVARAWRAAGRSDEEIVELVEGLVQGWPEAHAAWVWQEVGAALGLADRLLEAARFREAEAVGLTTRKLVLAEALLVAGDAAGAGEVLAEVQPRLWSADDVLVAAVLGWFAGVASGDEVVEAFSAMPPGAATHGWDWSALRGLSVGEQLAVVEVLDGARRDEATLEAVKAAIGG